MFLENNDLWDFQLQNYKYTWFGPNGKYSRLDRAIINFEWASLVNWVLIDKGRRFSDNSAILIGGTEMNWGPKLYKVFNVWLPDANFRSLMKTTWEIMNSTQFNLQTKLKKLRESIKHWNSGANGNSVMRVKELEAKLDEVDANNIDHEQRKRLHEQLVQAYKIREAILKQKSRLQWDKFGESNTKFFHSMIKHRQQINNVQCTRYFYSDFQYFKDFFNKKSIDLYFNLESLIEHRLNQRESEYLDREFLQKTLGSIIRY